MRISALNTGILACVLLAGGSAPAEAALFEFFTSESPFTPGVKNQGWWPGDPNENDDTNDNYIVGFLTDADGAHPFRNFFTFDLSSLSGTVIGAQLDLTVAEVNNLDGEPMLYSLFDVSTDPAVLNNNVNVNAAIFADLGTGASYGSTSVDLATGSYPNTILSIPLNAFAIGDINGAGGGFFSIGGALAGGAEDPDSVFGLSQHELLPNGIQRLVVETEDNGSGPGVVPEPGSLFLLGTGLMGLAGLHRRSRRAS